MEEKAEKALQLIDALEGAEGDQFVQLVVDQVGKEMLSIFGSYAANVFPGNPEEVIRGLVHLMIVAYLMKANEAIPLFPPSVA